jgi:hypothetical protein
MMKIEYIENSKETPCYCDFTDTNDNLFLPKGILSNPRQTRKIVGCFRNPKFISQRDVTISEKELDSFFLEVARKEITDKKTIEKAFQNLVSRIKGNILKIKMFPMFEIIKADRHLIGILAYFTHGSLYRRDEVRAIDILEFLVKFPDPYTFQFEAKDFLDIIEIFNSRDKRKEYEESMKTFMELLYGKQFEYLMQINLIRRKAKQDYFKKSFKDMFESLSVRPVNKKNGREMLNRLKIDGSPFNGEILTPEIVEKNGLQPKYKMSVYKSEMACFSSAYDIGLGRTAVVAYIKKDGNYIPRSYYLSNSHAIWRYLEEYISIEGKIVSYGTGNKRDSTNLPLVFQKSLSIIAKNGVSIIDSRDRELIFAGTSFNALSEIGEKSIHALETECVPQKLHGNFYQENGKRTPPDELKFYNYNQAPDFSKFITGWELGNKTYGKITYQAFLSKDNRLIYTFCKDEIGRAWIGSIENHSNIQSTGLRETWIDGGDLTTPAYEYIEKAGNYGNRNLRWGDYIDMSKNYLSKILIIG